MNDKVDWANYGQPAVCRRCGRRWRNVRAGGPRPLCNRCRTAEAQRRRAGQQGARRKTVMCVQCNARPCRANIQWRKGPTPFCSASCAVAWACGCARVPALTTTE